MDAAPGVEGPAGGRLAAADEGDAADHVLAGPVAAGRNVLGSVDRMEPAPVVDDVPAAVAVEGDAARHVLAEPVPSRCDRGRAAEGMHRTPAIEHVATAAGPGRDAASDRVVPARGIGRWAVDRGDRAEGADRVGA